MKKVADTVKEMEGVEKTEMLTGLYDVMVVARAEKLSSISDILIEKIRNIEGVEDTVTNVFIEQD